MADFEMTQAQLCKLLEACRPVPVVKILGQWLSQQENANAGWEDLGNEMGFDYMTVKPSAKGQRFFSAEVMR